MRQNSFAIGSATFLIIFIAGFLSATWADRHYANGAAQTPPTSTACVTEDGSWKNWVWANVPMLSPKCPSNQ